MKENKLTFLLTFVIGVLWCFEFFFSCSTFCVLLFPASRGLSRRGKNLVVRDLCLQGSTFVALFPLLRLVTLRNLVVCKVSFLSSKSNFLY